MRKKIILLVALALPASSLGAAEFSRISQADAIIENRAGTIVVVPQLPLVGRLHYFAVTHGADIDTAPELAELLAACSHPRVMAAIASVESDFTPGAVGRSGEVSMFQVLDWPGGDPLDTAHALDVAVRVLEDKLSDVRSLREAIRAYNGSGVRAESYREKVLSRVREI